MVKVTSRVEVVNKKTGIILSNIGSPLSYEEKDVAIYLHEFLMDKGVINLPYILRWILVYIIIVPRRAKFSAANYKKVWMNGESPLLYLTKKLQRKLAEKMNLPIEIGMRYSKPSLQESIDRLTQNGVSEILLCPMYPQYSAATTRSTTQRFNELEVNSDIQIKYLKPFYNHKAFIDSWVQQFKKYVPSKSEYVLFSYHGLPEQMVKQTPGCQLNSECCQRPEACALNCYKAQCLKTTELIANGLGLKAGEYGVSFQSRLGRSEWIKPYTSAEVQRLAAEGTKHLVVLCPAFVTDCIETIEEIGMGIKDEFIAAGGEKFDLIPCLNDEDHWVDGFKEILQNTIS